MIHIDLKFRPQTPLFLGDAGQQAEWRAASLKGALRWWYRAVDPQFRDREPVLFGGTGDGYGQSLMLLQTPEPKAGEWRWDAARARRFTEGSGRQSRNGLVYLGYPFQMAGNEHRTAIAPGTELNVQVKVPRPNVPITAHGEEANGSALPLSHGVLAAWWLLGTFGAMGTRSRRGFGSLLLADWKVDEPKLPNGTSPANAERVREWQDELKRLPKMTEPRDAEAWRRQAHAGLSVCREWFGDWDGSPDTHHPHLGREFRWKLLPQGFRGRDWEQALNYAGRLMQDFRQRREPDYSDVKRHLQRAGQLRHAPDRATFGMPLTFRYGSVPQGGTIEFVPSGVDLDDRADGDRHASLLLLKLVRIGDALHPLFVRMAGDVPGQEPRAAIARRSSRGLPLERARRNAMDEFFDSLEAV